MARSVPQTQQKPAPQQNAVTTGDGEQRQKKPMELFRDEMKVMEKQFRLALPRHITTEAFTRNLITAVQEEPKLLECTRQSVLNAAMKAAQLGLMVGSALGQAYILPFKNKGIMEATLIPGYRGYIVLARNSGEVESVSAYEVCKEDLFDFELGLEPKLKHKPALGDRGHITHFYCVVRYKDGGFHVEVMTTRDVDAIRARSKSPDSPAWKNDYMMMGRKSVIRRAARYMPLSVQRLAAIDNALDEGKTYSLDDYEGITIEGNAEVVDGDDSQDAGESDEGGRKRLDDFAKGKQAAKKEQSIDVPKEEEPQEAPYHFVDTEGVIQPCSDGAVFADALQDAIEEAGDSQALQSLWKNNQEGLKSIAAGVQADPSWLDDLKSVMAERTEALKPKPAAADKTPQRKPRESKKAEAKKEVKVDLRDEAGDAVGAPHSSMETWFRDLDQIIANAVVPADVIDRNNDGYYQWRGVDMEKADKLWEAAKAKVPAEQEA